ncbi:hypothetical protein PAXRUDRAFT_166282, partial [Paxillus rubicundulus Ve08.2h10]
IGPSNFQIWKLWIMAKLWREKVLGVALGMDICLIIPVTSLSTSGTTTTVPKVHGIIQDSISNALLLKMEAHTTIQDLCSTLLSIHQASNLASTFYISQQLFNSARTRTSVSKHITSIQTLEACLAEIKFVANSRLLAFVLLNSLLKMPEWDMFTSSIINTVGDSRLTFNAVETQINLRMHTSTLQDLWTLPSRSPTSPLPILPILLPGASTTDTLDTIPMTAMPIRIG